VSDNGEYEPKLSKYYPVSTEIPNAEIPEISIKNIALAFFLLGLIAFMVNALMVFLFIRQAWVMTWPHTSAAQAGVAFMIVGGGIYLANYIMEKKNL
jgi:hypothetical protein